MQTSVSPHTSNQYELYGVEQGARCCNLKRSSELNERISARNVPTTPLQPHFSSRPVSTKYDMMSILDRRVVPTVPLKRVPTYDMKTNFNPGSAKAPWEGFVAHQRRIHFAQSDICAPKLWQSGVCSVVHERPLRSGVAVATRCELTKHSLSSKKWVRLIRIHMRMW